VKVAPTESRSTCPVAGTLDLVGDRWTLLVLRDVMMGKHHYDELLQSSEGIATNILAERLKRLQALGMLTMTVDETNRRRKRYELTDLGRSFGPVLTSIALWGLEHIEGTKPSPEVRAALEAEVARRRAAKAK
jgi:DNA-binding HxlR family transcriptional regulator